MQMLFLLIPCYLVSYYAFHLYDPKRVTSRKSQAYNIFKANVVGILYCTAGLYFIKSGNYARLFIVIFVITNFILELIFRLLITTILRRFRKRGAQFKACPSRRLRPFGRGLYRPYLCTSRMGICRTRHFG